MVPRRRNTFRHGLHKPTILQRGRLTADRPSSPPNTRAGAPRHDDGDERSDRDEYTGVAAARRRLPRATRTEPGSQATALVSTLPAALWRVRRSVALSPRLVPPSHEGAVRLPVETDVQLVTAEPLTEIGNFESD